MWAGWLSGSASQWEAAVGAPLAIGLRESARVGASMTSCARSTVQRSNSVETRDSTTSAHSDRAATAAVDGATDKSLTRGGRGSLRIMT